MKWVYRDGRVSERMRWENMSLGGIKERGGLMDANAGEMASKMMRYIAGVSPLVRIECGMNRISLIPPLPQGWAARR